MRADDWGTFLTTIFDDWVRADVGRIYVQQFDVALGIWLGAGSSLCVFAKNCGKALAIEHNGDLYSCDHFVYPEYRLGNIMEKSLREMAESEAQTKFGRDKSRTLPRYCRACEVRFACQGECPKHRFLRTPDGEWGSELPVRGLPPVLQPHRPVHEGDGRAAGFQPRPGGDHGADRAAGPGPPADDGPQRPLPLRERTQIQKCCDDRHGEEQPIEDHSIVVIF